MQRKKGNPWLPGNGSAHWNSLAKSDPMPKDVQGTCERHSSNQLQYPRQSLDREENPLGGGKLSSKHRYEGGSKCLTVWCQASPASWSTFGKRKSAAHSWNSWWVLCLLGFLFYWQPSSCQLISMYCMNCTSPGPRLQEFRLGLIQK